MLALGILAAIAMTQQGPVGLYQPNTGVIEDRLTPVPVHFDGGLLGTRFDANWKARLLKVDEDDLLDCFERRNEPHQDWQGEHVGKFLHAATLAWVNTQSPELKAKIGRVVTRLIKTQEADGYLGAYPAPKRWTAWDVWVHKYAILGLLTYYQYTDDRDALAAARRAGDLLVATFGPTKKDINRAGEHIGMAATSVLEPVVLLYRATNDKHYLDFAKYIVANYDAPGGPAILNSLERTGSVRLVANGKAYEMTSNFNGLLELYRVTGDPRLKKDLLAAWQDIADHRLYLTGSGSNYEVWTDGDTLPNGQEKNPNETCVTVSWEQMNLQLLRITGDPRFADQIEKTVYNHLLGAQKPSGDAWCYYSGLSGQKPYGSETNCCLSSGPRGVALLASIACMRDEKGGVYVNLYNAGTASAGKVTLTQKTDYPVSGHIEINVALDAKQARFPLHLRIPAWANGKAALHLNGRNYPLEIQNGYAVIDRDWRTGDKVSLDLPVQPHVVMGDHSNVGRAAVLYGPYVMTVDTVLNPGISDPTSLSIDGKDLHVAKATDELPGEIRLTGHVLSPNGKSLPITYTPFAFAGRDGLGFYAVWLKRK